MISITLFPVFLLSVRILQVESDAAVNQVLTFNETDPTTGKTVVCDRCRPGTYLQSRCTSKQKSVCAPCPPGSFTELWNHISKCLRCGVCGQNQVVKAACAPDRDCQCECKDGYYYKKSYDMCLLHSRCPSGEGVLTKGTPNKDTVCQICPNGTYSSSVSAQENCTEHKSCNAAGQKLVLKGSTWHDSVCTNGENHISRDGADYLKEILPAFFVQHKMPIKRVRRIVQKLGGNSHRPSGLNLSALHDWIDTWVASATASQIRQLPKILTDVGAESASERLHSKLHRIDSNLQELSGLQNEVEVIVIELLDTKDFN